ncbi:MAG: hydrogenase maturation protein HypF [Rhodospirillales bacterium]|nr:hydrogenase maturation protein HypF [Rhodospirillales bacterium]
MSDDIIRLPIDYKGPAILGLGAYLKNTITVLKDGEALMSPNLGDIGSVEAIKAFEVMVERMIDEAGVKPAYAAHDLHPDFYSTHYAKQSDMEAVAVQHHHAHVATVMAEHNYTDPVLGFAMDGFGLGHKNQSWGGEALFVDAFTYKRFGYLRLIKQPGGDIAAREPWRMGAAVLHELGREDEINELYKDIPGASIVAQMLTKNVNSPLTSSGGRLFDAACGLLGVKLVSEFEGEAPMALEAMVTTPIVDPEGWTSDQGSLDFMPLMGKLVGMDPVEGANLFHGTLVAGLDDVATQLVEGTKTKVIALCGGCFFNKVLRENLTEALQKRGLKVMFPSKTGPGDPGLSLGQAWAVAMKIKGSH